MLVERSSGSSNLINVLDRVLDKGIVIDAWVRVSLVGIDLLTVEARVVVASIATYLQYSPILDMHAVAMQGPQTAASSGRRLVRPESRGKARRVLKAPWRASLVADAEAR
jgi:gas vesicle structural protein